jgi:hypothetical protein
VASRLREGVERGFEAWGRRVGRRPVAVLLVCLAFVAVCAAGLPGLHVDVSFEAFLRAKDPVRVAYDRFRERFGRDERIVVAIRRAPDAEGPGDVFDAAFLAKLRDLHDAIAADVPYVEELTSLVNARDTRGEGDTLYVEDFLDPWPETEADLARLRARALANPLFRNTVLSADARITTIAIEPWLHSAGDAPVDDLGGFDSDIDDAAASAGSARAPLLSSRESAELVARLRGILAGFEGPDFEIHVGGSTVMLNDVTAAMMHDMPRFVALAIATIAVLLFALFRRAVAVVAPLVVVILSVVCTFGLMGWTDTRIHAPTQILPSFLLAVGVGDAVHLLAIFFERLRRGEAREEALARALGHSGLALVLTSLTTAAGLASFATAGVAPVAALGVFAPIGVMIALGLSLSLLPAIVRLWPGVEPAARDRLDAPNRLDRVLVGLGTFAARHPRRIVVVSALLWVASAAGASQLVLSHDPLSWLGDEAEIVRDTAFIDRELGGSVSFEVLVQTPERDGVRRPEVLERMARLGRSYEEIPRDGLVAGQTTSLADVVKEINRALNADREEAYVIPDDPRLVAQELLLFENTGTDDLEELVDADYRTARIAVRMPWRDAVGYTDFFDAAEADARSALGDSATTSMTGVLALLVRSLSALVVSIASSYLIAFAVITPLMVLLLGSLRLGLLAMLPNLTPILLTLGLMGVAGFPLDAFSLLIGGIALGLAVDDTIHFMHNYRRERDGGAAREDAVEKTLRSTGRAMLITTCVLSLGFLGFVLSSMQNLVDLGILVSFAIATAFVADVLLAPALLALVDDAPAARGGASEGSDAPRGEDA